MIDIPSPVRVAAIATARIDDLIDEMRRRVPVLDTEDRDIGVKILAYTEAKVAILEAALKSYEPPALLTYPEPEQATLPGIAAGERPHARRVTGTQVLRYLADRDGGSDFADITRDLFAGHRHARQNCRNILMRLGNDGLVKIHWDTGSVYLVTLGDNASRASALPPSVEEN